MFTLRTKLSILRALLTRRAPYYIQFYINGRCNLMCRQCNIVEANSGIGELSLQQIEVVADNIRKIHGGIVLLTGGEPFLRQDIDQIAKIFIERGLDVRLQTAGIATREQLQKCYDAGCRDLNISLDSLNPAKGDYINAVPGSWKKTVEAIERVSEIFRDESAICSLGCVLSRFNYREIPAILEFATRIGWYLSLVPVHITQRDAYRGFRSYDDDFVFHPQDYPDLHRVVDELVAMQRQGALLFDSAAFLKSAVGFIETGQVSWRKNGVCDSPNLYFAVRPNGDFATCCDHFLDQPPSLTDPDFWKLYKSGAIARGEARAIVESCEGCHYGSYPEATLSVRDPAAFLSRTALTFFRRRAIIGHFEPGEMFDLIDEIRAKNPAAHSTAYLSDPVRERVEGWGDKASRRQMVQLDLARRKEEGRVRRPQVQ
ncbi:MAG: radical SAM protein [Acidobacteriota bacterium]